MLVKNNIISFTINDTTLVTLSSEELTCGDQTFDVTGLNLNKVIPISNEYGILLLNQSNHLFIFEESKIVPLLEEHIITDWTETHLLTRKVENNLKNVYDIKKKNFLFSDGEFQCDILFKKYAVQKFNELQFCKLDDQITKSISSNSTGKPYEMPKQVSGSFHDKFILNYKKYSVVYDFTLNDIILRLDGLSQGTVRYHEFGDQGIYCIAKNDLLHLIDLNRIEYKTINLFESIYQKDRKHPRLGIIHSFQHKNWIVIITIYHEIGFYSLESLNFDYFFKYELDSGARMIKVNNDSIQKSVENIYFLDDANNLNSIPLPEDNSNFKLSNDQV